MKLKSFADKLTVAIIYLLTVEIAVSLALAINFMYDYHFFTSDSSYYPIQKLMNLKTQNEYVDIEDYVTLYLKENEGVGKKVQLSEQDKTLLNALSEKYNKENTNLVFSASISGVEILKNDDVPDDYCYSKQTPFSVYIEGRGTFNGILSIYIPSKDSMHVQDGYQLAISLINTAHSLRFVIFVLLFLLVCLTILLLGLLMSTVGNNIDSKSRLFFIDRIPFDLFSVIAFFLIAFVIVLILLTSAADIKDVSIVLWNMVILILTFVDSLIVLAYCLTLARRIKIGHLLRNTLVYKLLSLIRKKNRRGKSENLKVPILGKALISIGVVILLELISVFYFVYEYKTCLSGRLSDFKFLYFAFSQVAVVMIIGALFFMIFFNLNRVRESGQKIAAGDFDKVADSHIMFGDFKAINDDLITIKDDMIQALEEKNKSQKMRTELITNISHDIKTPLTSIVNYADIISSGKCNPDETKSYSDIIKNQSAKLNDLLFNLIEVSKISTGAVKVNSESINLNLFISQTAEEFSLKFKEKNLIFENSFSDENILITADGLILWRVFDNLFSNIVKYAMPNTRVYLDVKKMNSKVVISLKNISENPISSSAEDLLMRFKRDDSSRHTKGNGLGLTIAKSFVELQNGTFNIDVDGDMFKTTIELNLAKEK